VFLTLALAATLGLVSCGGGQSQEAPATEEVVEEVAIDSATVSETTEVEAVEESAEVSEEAPVQE
jgi:ABC-type glycerol-3-phosphate transport system substrate-binding protein